MSEQYRLKRATRCVLNENQLRFLYNGDQLKDAPPRYKEPIDVGPNIILDFVRTYYHFMLFALKVFAFFLELKFYLVLLYFPTRRKYAVKSS